MNLSEKALREILQASAFGDIGHQISNDTLYELANVSGQSYEDVFQIYEDQKKEAENQFPPMGFRG